MNRTAATVLLLALATTPAAVRADDAPTTTTTTVVAPVNTKETAMQRIQRMVAKINAEASTPEGEARVVAGLSKQFAVAPDTLEAQHADWGLGYGEMSMVYGFARSSKTKATPGQVVDMRRSGMSWENIGKKLGVKVDAVASRMKKSATPKPVPTK
ncbi:MAG TPA: hypothetical protein VFT97_02945 [Candidatus Eisenbacteria bacterium]|nr:hypothetical protein [Candidatus Eisenbacteria bacterium]